MPMEKVHWLLLLRKRNRRLFRFQVIIYCSFHNFACTHFVDHCCRTSNVLGGLQFLNIGYSGWFQILHQTLQQQARFLYPFPLLLPGTLI